MKRLLVDSYQRNCLLLMASRLCDGFTTIRWGLSYQCDFIWMDSLPEIEPEPIEIHWFELSLVHLPELLHDEIKRVMERVELTIDEEEMNTLISKYEPELIPLDIMDLLYTKEIHPIDSLWGEFKKLQIWDSLIKKDVLI